MGGNHLDSFQNVGCLLLELSGSKVMLKHFEAAARVAEDEIYTPNIVSLVSEEMSSGWDSRPVLSF